MATCSPSELLASGSCFQCLTKKELQIVIAQLLCEISSGGGGNSGPKVYRALLSQTGTDAPVATVLENTLGSAIIWTRDGIGSYIASADFDFDRAKTMVMGGGNYTQGGSGNIASIGAEVDVPGWAPYAGNVLIATRNPIGNATDSGPVPLPIEILVYP